MFLIQELIAKKRLGKVLSRDEIYFLIDGITKGTVADSQVGAFAMAVCFQDMTKQERIDLTCAMRDSGQVLNWRSLNLSGPILDKHSTGGVGDVTSLILGPLIAACGGYVPMISGRGLGHTGGTLDKLEAIPGYQVEVSNQKIGTTLQSAGVAIIGQSGELAPADKRIYAIRDVTATVDNISLITASILAKKLAAGLDALVMDVKVGSGAFMPSYQESQNLAQSIVDVANGAGTQTRALLTDMNQVLAQSAGNALEIKEVIALLTGDVRSSRLYHVTMALCQELLVMGKLAHHAQEAKVMLERALQSGEAAERFNRMVACLGGPNDIISTYQEHLPQAKIVRPVFSSTNGIIGQIDTKQVGMAVVELGGGRKQPTDKLNYSVGLEAICGVGEEVDSQRPLALIHAQSEEDWQRAARRLQQAIVTTQEPVESITSVYQTIE
ncbi:MULTISPECIES: thymidine phosphorylase [unclassified Vibrio]|uniref:Thymidine phosphorylase n=1 Tax=Vibrio sp. HB236076 TaxID=3232307 RepID=A0AB39HET6_9VIBR|nr:thymidine phosphorylase [Vibrio sp. HB161653]MDP5254078.1 thymidine phosphorylase [Vibrio sp. HB161653]